MKILFKNAIFLLSSVLIVNIPLSSARANNNLTVTFKPGTNEKYIRVINLLTNNPIDQKLDQNTYKINVIDPNNSLNLFYTIPEVLLVNNGNQLQGKKSGDLVEGQIIVRFKANISSLEIKKLDQKFKTQSKLISSSLNLYIVKLPPSLKALQAIEVFKKTKMIEYAEADRVMKIQKKGFGIQSIPMQKQLSISFKKPNQELAASLFNIIYENNLIKQTDNTYLLNIEDKINPDYLIKALKSSRSRWLLESANSTSLAVLQ